VKLIPQEIFLLERYASVAYFSELRDTWAEMIIHLEKCMEDFVRNLPSGFFRWRPPDRPDIVWREHVVPNFHDTLKSLNDGYSALQSGDLAGLGHAHGPLNDLKGQSDYWSGWMIRDDENLYGALLNKAVLMAGNIVATTEAYWSPLKLSLDYDERARGPLNAPVHWPDYKLSPTVTVSSGTSVLEPGIYIPDIDDSCAQFLWTETAPEAIVLVGERALLAPDTGLKYGNEPIYAERPCKWIMVEKIIA
jgi:hypothetical protein